MLLQARVQWSCDMIGFALENAESSMVFGSGVWFKMLQHSFFEVLDSLELKPAVFRKKWDTKVLFKNTATIHFFDIEKQPDFRKIPVPENTYLVEDAPGLNEKIWINSVLPFLLTGNTKINRMGE
jgi:hypothetical protein